MEKIVEIKDLSFAYLQKTIYQNLSLSISVGSIYTVMGPSGSGKSTLAHILIGLEPSHDYIKIDDEYLNTKNIDSIRNKISFLTEHPDRDFISDSVLEELKYSLERKGYEEEQIEEEVSKISEELDIKNLLTRNPHQLSGGEKQLVQLALGLLGKPKLLILDNAFVMMDTLRKEKAWKLLLKYNKEISLTILNFTSDSEDILKSTDFLILDKGTISFQKKARLAFQKEKVFTTHQIALPFIANLSNKLRYYKVIPSIQTNQKKLVDMLWK